MPIKIDPELAALRQAAKAPREGFFSVLDELIGQLPEGRALSVDELRQRLKPGRTLERGGIKFPLKQTELDYALPELSQWSPELRIESRDRLRDFVRKRRPEFTDARQDVEGLSAADYSNYSTHGPGRFDYFENITESPDFGKHSTHFTDNTLSFSRGSRHELPGGWVDRNGQNHSGGILRLIDEIQNDRANAARAKRGPQSPSLSRFLSPEDQAAHRRFMAMPGTEYLNDPEYRAISQRLREAMDRAANERVGWVDNSVKKRLDEKAEREGLTPEEMDEYNLRVNDAVPDMPFKTPQEYGRFEIKKQILNALDAGDEYLGITPSSGPASWFPGTGAKDTTYDKIYPGELRKIAQQYGAEFSDIGLPVKSYDPLALNTLQGTDIVDFVNTMDWERGEPLEAAQELINELATHYRSPRGYDPRSGEEDPLDFAQTQLDIVREMEDNLDAIRGTRDPHPDELTELQESRDQLSEALEDLYNETVEQQRSLGKGTFDRQIPSMHLTPEIKEKIARIGLPLFTVAGASLLAPGQEGEEEMPAYAGGGVVRKSAGMLKRIRDAEEKASRGRANEAAWADDFGAAGGRKAPEAGGYGDWAAKSAGKASRKASDGPKKGRKGALSTIRDYLGLYEGGSARLADMYPDAFEGEYEDGDEFLGEDEEWEYYACGGPVKLGIGGKLKKAVKKVAKVGKALAPVIGKIPGVGTVAGGLIGGVSGLIADGNLKGALSGALSGASGGVSNALLSNAMGLGSALLDANNAKSKAKKTAAAQAPAAVGVPPERIAQVPDLMQLQQQAQQTQAAMPSQLSMVQPQGQRVQPGSNAGGLLQRIQQQQAAFG